MSTPKRIVALSGSLRAGSNNAAMLKLAGTLLPSGVEYVMYDDTGALPHFNPDLDVEPPPVPIANLRRVMGAAHGFVFSTPEYAHNIPGTLKNALDWMVGGGELMQKPVLVVNAAAAGADRAQASLIQTLKAMDTRVLVEDSLLAPFVKRKLDGKTPPDPDVVRLLSAAMAALLRATEIPPAL